MGPRGREREGENKGRERVSAGAVSPGGSPEAEEVPGVWVSRSCRGCGAGCPSGPECASVGHLVAVLGGGEPALGIHLSGPGTWEKNAGASLCAPGTPLCRPGLHNPPRPAPRQGPCGCRHPERGEAGEAGEPWQPDAVRVSRWRGPGPLAPAWPFLLVETLVVCVLSRPDPGEQHGGPLILWRATARGRGAPADQWAWRPCRGSVETWRW